MSSFPWLPGLPGSSAPALRAGQLARRLDPDPAEPAAVVELRPVGLPPPTAEDVARYAGRVAASLDRPLFRLALSDLAAPAPQRAGAVLRLVDAAEVAVAVVLLDMAERVVPGTTAAEAVRQRVTAWRGGVVLLATSPGSSAGRLAVGAQRPVAVTRATAGPG